MGDEKMCLARMTLIPRNVRPWNYKYVYTHVHNMGTARRNTCNIKAIFSHGVQQHCSHHMQHS